MKVSWCQTIITGRNLILTKTSLPTDMSLVNAAHLLRVGVELVGGSACVRLCERTV